MLVGIYIKHIYDIPHIEQYCVKLKLDNYMVWYYACNDKLSTLKYCVSDLYIITLIHIKVLG